MQGDIGSAGSPGSPGRETTQRSMILGRLSPKQGHRHTKDPHYGPGGVRAVKYFEPSYVDSLKHEPASIRNNTFTQSSYNAVYCVRNITGDVSRRDVCVQGCVCACEFGFSETAFPIRIAVPVCNRFRPWAPFRNGHRWAPVPIGLLLN